MASVTVSPKYQIVIPEEVRKEMGIRPGMKLEVFCIGGRMEIIELRPLEEMRGILKGLDPSFEREEEDRI